MTDPGQYPPPTPDDRYQAAYGDSQYPPPPAAPKKRGGFPLWGKIAVGVVAALVLLGIGVAAGGGPAKVETKTVAGPQTTLTATATVNVTATVTATPPPPTATVTTTFTPQPVVAFSEGQFSVPDEVQPGKYHTDGGSQCYYAVLSSLDGGLGSIITNNNFDGPQTISIPSSAAGIQTNGSCDWTKVG